MAKQPKVEYDFNKLNLTMGRADGQWYGSANDPRTGRYLAIVFGASSADQLLDELKERLKYAP